MIAKDKIINILNNHYGFNLKDDSLIPYEYALFQKSDKITSNKRMDILENQVCYIIAKNKNFINYNYRDYVLITEINKNEFSVELSACMQYDEQYDRFTFKDDLKINPEYLKKGWNTLKRDCSVMEHLMTSKKYGSEFEVFLRKNRYNYNLKFTIYTSLLGLKHSIETDYYSIYFKVKGRQPIYNLLQTNEFLITIKDHAITSDFRDRFGDYVDKQGFTIDFDNECSLNAAKNIIEIINI